MISSFSCSFAGGVLDSPFLFRFLLAPIPLTAPPFLFIFCLFLVWVGSPYHPSRYLSDPSTSAVSLPLVPLIFFEIFSRHCLVSLVPLESQPRFPLSPASVPVPLKLSFWLAEDGQTIGQPPPPLFFSFFLNYCQIQSHQI